MYANSMSLIYITHKILFPATANYSKTPWIPQLKKRLSCCHVLLNIFIHGNHFLESATKRDAMGKWSQHFEHTYTYEDHIKKPLQYWWGKRFSLNFSFKLKQENADRILAPSPLHDGFTELTKVGSDFRSNALKSYQLFNGGWFPQLLVPNARRYISSTSTILTSLLSRRTKSNACLSSSATKSVTDSQHYVCTRWSVYGGKTIALVLWHIFGGRPWLSYALSPETHT